MNHLWKLCARTALCAACARPVVIPRLRPCAWQGDQAVSGHGGVSARTADSQYERPTGRDRVRAPRHVRLSSSRPAIDAESTRYNRIAKTRATGCVHVAASRRCAAR
eukprot:963269-Prymnesium_polylepis.1